MQTASVKLYSLRFDDLATYLAAAAFAAGNILFPWLCHAVPGLGARLLPIYFFTLVGACKYGWRVGLLTAVLSTVFSSALSGMPAAAAMPGVLFKSVAAACAAGWAASRLGRVSLWMLGAVVLFYQSAGLLFEWAVTGDMSLAWGHAVVGLPGMLLQIFGIWAVIRFLLRK